MLRCLRIPKFVGQRGRLRIEAKDDYRSPQR